MAFNWKPHEGPQIEFCGSAEDEILYGGAAGGEGALTEAQVLEYIKKKKGLDIASLDQLQLPEEQKTPEQIEKENQERRARAVAHGITNNLFSENDMKSYNVDSEKPAEVIAFELFKAEQLSKDNTLTEETIQERFNQRFYVDHEEDSWLRKDGLQQMQLLKDAYINNKYQNILNVDNVYDSYVQTENAARNYRTEIDKIFDGYNRVFTHTIQDTDLDGKTPLTHEFKFNVDEGLIKTIKDSFLTQEHFERLIDGGVDMQSLPAIVNMAIKEATMSKLITEVAKAYASKVVLAREAERKGIKPVGNGGSDMADVEKSDVQKAIEEIKGKGSKK